MRADDQFHMAVEEVTLQSLALFDDDWSYFMWLRDFVHAGDYHELVGTLRDLRSELPVINATTLVVAAESGKQQLRELVRDAALQGELDEVLAEWRILLSASHRMPDLTWPVIKIKRPKHPDEPKKRKKSKKRKKK